MSNDLTKDMKMVTANFILPCAVVIIIGMVTGYSFLNYVSSVCLAWAMGVDMGRIYSVFMIQKTVDAIMNELSDEKKASPEEVNEAIKNLLSKLKR